MLIVLVLASCAAPAARPALRDPAESAPSRDTSAPTSIDTRERPTLHVDPESKRAGAIQGAVTDATTGERLAGVTVMVTSPALAHDRRATTDETGSYKIGELPAGDYVVTFYYAGITAERSGVHVGDDQTTPVFQKLNDRRAGGSAIHINDMTPTIAPDRVEPLPPICVYLHNCGI